MSNLQTQINELRSDLKLLLDQSLSISQLPTLSSIDRNALIMLEYNNSNFKSTISSAFSIISLSDIPNLQTALNNKADLINGLIPTNQLPSFVDDVVEASSFNQFPNTGESGKIYIDLSSNKSYRWSGSVYAELHDDKASWGNIEGDINAQSDLISLIDTKEPLINKSSAFNKNFGTTSGTVAQGNDSRIINGQTSFSWGDHSSIGYALASQLFSGDYNDLTNKPSIPSLSGYATESWVNTRIPQVVNKSFVDDLGVNATQLGGYSDYARTSIANTFGANQIIKTGEAVLVLESLSGTGNSHVGYISLKDSAGAEKGWIGYGSTSNSLLNITNAYGDVTINGNIAYHAGNSNKSTVDWAAKDLNISGRITFKTGAPAFFERSGFDTHHIGIDSYGFYAYNITKSAYDWVVSDNGTVKFRNNLFINNGNTDVGTYYQTTTSGTSAVDGFRVGYNNSNAFLWNFENNSTVFATNGVQRYEINNVGYNTWTSGGSFGGKVLMSSTSGIKGNSTGASNVSTFSFYEANGTTVQALIGMGSSNASNLYFSNYVTGKELVSKSNGILNYNGAANFEEYGRNGHSRGALIGSYNSVGANGDKTNPIYVIGSSYQPTDTTLGNMYGVGYADAAAAGFLNTTDLGSGFSGARWGMYVAASGKARVFLDGLGNGFFKNKVAANSFIKAGGTATQFLKADGSVDSNSYLTASGLSDYARKSQFNLFTNNNNFSGRLKITTAGELFFGDSSSNATLTSTGAGLNINSQNVNFTGTTSGISYNDLDDTPSNTGSRPYTVITGLVSQSGTSNPTFIILENNTGQTFGNFGILSSGTGGFTVGFLNGFTFSQDDVYFSLTNNVDFNSNRVLRMDVHSTSSFIFRGFDNGVGTTGLFTKVPFEIRFYNNQL